MNKVQESKMNRYIFGGVIFIAAFLPFYVPPPLKKGIENSFCSGRSSQLCYSCLKSASMDECDMRATEYNCSKVGAFHTKCASFCDWKKGFYMRECAMDLKCKRLQRECDERKAIQEQKQKEPECEYKCCEGNLCNTAPCNLGQNIRSQWMGVAGVVLVISSVIMFFPLTHDF